MLAPPPDTARRPVTLPAAPEEERYRSCCDCCHIKVGTVILGLLEALVACGLLLTFVQQLLWKTRNQALCHSSLLRDCLIFQFSHFNVTLFFDWVITCLLICVLISILLLFCGVMSDTSSLLFPHLFIQAAFLLFSIGYFILYAWSFFYGDLYTNHRVFTIQGLVERMWLASLLLIIAAGQTYLFFAVAKCTIYLSKLHDSRQHRESAFWRMSERVRIAKENGLWRNNELGGFMQYTKQYEEEKNSKKKTPKEGHIKFNMEPKVVVLEETEDEDKTEKSKEEEKRPSQATPVVVITQPKDTIAESVSSSPKTSGGNREAKRSASDRDKERHHHSRRREEHLEAEKDPLLPISRNTRDLGSASTTVRDVERAGLQKETSFSVKSSNEKGTRARERKVGSHPRTSSSSSPEKPGHNREAKEKKDPERLERSPKTAEGSRHRTERSPEKKVEGLRNKAKAEYTQNKVEHSKRLEESSCAPSTSAGPPMSSKTRGVLRKLKSVDSAEQMQLPPEGSSTKSKSRRRSSATFEVDQSYIQGGTEATTSHRHHPHHQKPERQLQAINPALFPMQSGSERQKHQDSGGMFKKVSISASGSPFA